MGRRKREIERRNAGKRSVFFLRMTADSGSPCECNMRENNKWKKIFVFGAAVAVIAAAIFMFCASPEVKLKQKVYTLEAGSVLPNTAGAYAEYADKVDEEKVSIHMDGVDVYKIGKYDAFLKYGEKAYPFVVEVVDTTAPVAVLKEELLVAKAGEKLKAAELVEVNDATECRVLFADEEGNKSEEYDCMEAGQYELKIVITDAAENGAETVQRLEVKNADETAPVISGAKSITVYVGEAPDYMDGISAVDETDGDLTGNVVVDSSDVDINKKGNYSVIYSCKDAAGNESKAEVDVTVKEKEKQSTSVKKETTKTNDKPAQENTVKTEEPKKETPNKEEPKKENKPAAEPEAPKKENTPEPKPEEPKKENNSTPAPKPEEPKKEDKPASKPEDNNEAPDQLDMSQFDDGWTPPQTEEEIQKDNEEYDKIVSGSDVGK